MTSHSSILVWEAHEQRSLGGYSPWDRKESDATEQFSLEVSGRLPQVSQGSGAIAGSSPVCVSWEHPTAQHVCVLNDRREPLGQKLS